MASKEVNQMLAVAAAACEDKKAEDIRILALDPVESGLADYFLTQGPILEVTIGLEQDASNASGYRWTTGQGPATAVTPGTLAEVSVVVSDVAPVQRIVR